MQFPLGIDTEPLRPFFMKILNGNTPEEIAAVLKTGVWPNYYRPTPEMFDRLFNLGSDDVLYELLERVVSGGPVSSRDMDSETRFKYFRQIAERAGPKTRNSIRRRLSQNRYDRPQYEVLMRAADIEDHAARVKFLTQMLDTHTPITADLPAGSMVL